MFEIGDRVRVKHGVFYQGYDLTNMIGIIKSLNSYINIYLPEIGLSAKMFRHEIEPYTSNTFEVLVEDFENWLHTGGLHDN
jgi:hypothetical protein